MPQAHFESAVCNSESCFETSADSERDAYDLLSTAVSSAGSKDGRADVQYYAQSMREGLGSGVSDVKRGASKRLAI